MSKYYAVKKGRHPGVYQTWPECQREVVGFSGAVYHSFPTRREAQAWLQAPQRSQQTSLDLGSFDAEIPADNDYDIRFFTDGGSRNHGNKRGQHVKRSDKAAWALLVCRGSQEIKRTGGEFGSTNNRMELMGFRNALQLLLANSWEKERIQAILDSHYVLDPIMKGWLYGWARRGWQTSTGKPVANQELWQEVLSLLPRFDHLQLKWTKGHADNHGNVIVDQLLNQTMDKMEAER